MRGSIIGRRVSAHPSALGSVPFQALIPSSSAAVFSTSASGGGRGSGRGRGSGGFGSFTPGSSHVKPDSDGPKPESNGSPFPSGLGHGRGKPIPSQPTQSIIPSFPSWTASVTPPPSSASGRGRGAILSPEPADSRSQSARPQGPGIPIPSSRDEGSEMGRQARPRVWGRGQDESVGKHHVANPQANGVLPPPIGSEIVHQARPRVWGSGRGAGDGVGKPVSDLQENGVVPALPSVDGGVGRVKPVQPSRGQMVKAEGENRHLRGRGGGDGGRLGAPTEAFPKLSREEAVKAAVGILSGGDTSVRGGGRGRGVGNQRGGRGERGRGRGRRGQQEDDDDAQSGLYLGDNADGEKLAKRLGVEKMNELHEGFKEMSSEVLPSPMDEAYLDALHTNYLIECEPEYLMEEFGTNPDIDETPPISLRDALEKAKPFLMAYENIQSHEEWEEAVEAAMQRAPNMKLIVDLCSGPDRITAKTQQEELEKVAKTIPESAPASVKRFANHAVQCLQSNPGWKFYQKYEFMDMLSRGVSQ